MCPRGIAGSAEKIRADKRHCYNCAMRSSKLRVRRTSLNFINRAFETNLSALPARKSPVALEGKGVGVFWILLRTGVADDGRMGLFARLDFSKVHGLVFFLNSESRMMASGRMR
jgi:hypothetical protein